jgi:hypothetical protein
LPIRPESRLGCGGGGGAELLLSLGDGLGDEGWVALASEPPEQADSASEPPSTTAAMTRPEAVRGARFTGDDGTWSA